MILGKKQILLKKGYYVVRVGDQAIMAGLDPRISTQAAALEAWEAVRKAAGGSERFFILWNPFDNYAWGEREECPQGTHFDPDTGTCVPDEETP